jgi:hypothetical protein
LKFSAYAVKEFSDFVLKNVLGPSDKGSPVVFGLLPKDLDHVEFGTIGRQKAQESVKFFHPVQDGEPEPSHGLFSN